MGPSVQSLPRGPPNPALFHQRRKTESRRPSLKPKPTSGTIQMQSSCRCRRGRQLPGKDPAIAVISAEEGFRLPDLVRVDIDNDNRTTSVSCRITVGGRLSRA